MEISHFKLALFGDSPGRKTVLCPQISENIFNPNGRLAIGASSVTRQFKIYAKMVAAHIRGSTEIKRFWELFPFVLREYAMGRRYLVSR
jgi:hypothetical protein